MNNPNSSLYFSFGRALVGLTVVGTVCYFLNKKNQEKDQSSTCHEFNNKQDEDQEGQDEDQDEEKESEEDEQTGISFDLSSEEEKSIIACPKIYKKPIIRKPRYIPIQDNVAIIKKRIVENLEGNLSVQEEIYFPSKAEQDKMPENLVMEEKDLILEVISEPLQHTAKLTDLFNSHLDYNPSDFTKDSEFIEKS